MQKFYTELISRNSFLAKSGTVCFILAGVIIFFPLFDPRELGGVSVWIKPVKFFLSLGIYFWTMGWLMDYLQDGRFIRKISWFIWILMVLEMILITSQAALGKLSHFNIETWRDAIIFQIMGIAIFLNSLAVLWVLIRFFSVKGLPAGYLTGIKIGFFIFLIAGYEGFWMAGKLSHTVGAPDGQEGIPFLGWAKAYGDLRVFHFLGLHALQIVPMMAWFFWKDKKQAVVWFGLVYFLLSSGTLWMALQGKGFSSYF